MLVTPTGRYARPGMRRKPSEVSTTLRVRSSLSSTPSSSQTTSNTNPAHPRSTSWVAPSPVGPPDHQLAHLEGNQWTHRSSQQPDQTNQTSSLRVTQLRELPNPGPPICGETQLGPPRIGHSLLRSDEPLWTALSGTPGGPPIRPCAETWVWWGGITHNGWCPMGGVRFFGGHCAWVARLDRGRV